MKRFLLIALVLAVAVVAPAAAKKGSATLAVSPAAPVSPTQIVLSGCGYAPGELVSVILYAPDFAGFTGRVPDGSGCISVDNFTALVPGAYTAKAFQSNSHHADAVLEFTATQVAAPTFVEAPAGATDAGGAWTYAPTFGSGNDEVVLLQVLQDGSTAGAVALTTVSNMNNLAGTGSAMTSIGSFNVGSPTAGIQHLWIGRIQTGAPSWGGTNSTSEDLYMRAYQWLNVSTGTTLATVIENATAGTSVNGVGTSTTCSDTGVTTLDTDRLAVNLGAITDDLSGIAVFTGQSGGTWANFQLYEDATGTDGSVFYEDAAMAAAGTINGGSDTITSLPWGVVGFALIGTTPPTPTFIEAPPLRAMQAVNRSNVY